jgi:hypothetical protein
VRLLAEIALVTIAAVGVAGCVVLLPRTRTAPRRRAAPPPARPAQIVRLERLVTTAATSAAHTHAYLRPVLAEIATPRLAARGIMLDRIDPRTGREMLGDELWDLVRADRPFPEERDRPGVSIDELGAMVDVLERL